MKLVIATPEPLVIARDAVVSLSARDESGAFGIMPGHVPFLTALAPSIVSWREADGTEGHCAVRGGLLTVSADGQEIAIATREAFPGDDIDALEQSLQQAVAAAAERERSERVATAQMQAAAIRRMIALLRPDVHPPGGTSEP